MHFSGIRQIRLGAIGIFMLFASWLGAVEKDAADYLPRHTAIAAGLDFTALCENPQSASVFKRVKVLLPEKLKSADKAFFSCDASGRRVSLLLSFLSPVNITDLNAVPGVELSASDESSPYPLYFVNHVPAERKPVRAAQITPEILAVYAAYHRHNPFAPDLQGMSAEMKSIVPRRKDILFWGYGVPGFNDPIVREIKYFDLTLELNIDGNIVLHGKVICKNNFTAILIDNMLPGILAVFLAEECFVPVDLTLSALNALNIRQERNVLRFSCTESEKVLELLSVIIENKLFNEKTAMENLK